MCWKLVSWGKHVCNAVILPAHWSYIVQIRVIGGGVAETSFSLLQDSVPSEWLWSWYFKVKELQSVAWKQTTFPLPSAWKWCYCCRHWIALHFPSTNIQEQNESQFINSVLNGNVKAGWNCARLPRSLVSLHFPGRLHPWWQKKYYTSSIGNALCNQHLLHNDTLKQNHVHWQFNHSTYFKLTIPQLH